MELTIENKSFDCYFATGNGGNKIYVLPSLDMVIGMASSAYNQSYMHSRSDEYLKRIVRATS